MRPSRRMAMVALVMSPIQYLRMFGIHPTLSSSSCPLITAPSPQVCTGVMLHGYPLVKTLCGGLQVCIACMGPQILTGLYLRV